MSDTTEPSDSRDAAQVVEKEEEEQEDGNWQQTVDEKGERDFPIAAEERTCVGETSTCSQTVNPRLQEIVLPVDYIPALEMRIRAMAALAELLSGAGAAASFSDRLRSASSSAAPS